ncbi:hypothetical protein ACTFIW_006661 [Dictyostelium discoideum]
MDNLYFKVFKNKYLFSIIYNYVKNGKGDGRQLKDIDLTIILENRFLFNLYYQSYLFNRNNENEINFKFQFNDIYILESFILSNIITIQEFILIYNDHENVLKKKKNKILKLSILNNKIGIEIIEFLIKFKNYKFDINHFQLYIGKMCKSKQDNINTILYVIDCFKNHSFNYNNKNNNNNNCRIISKQEKEKQKSNPLSLKFQPIMDCLDLNKVSCFQTIMDLSMDSIVDENGNDLPFKCKYGDIGTTRNQLIVRMVVLGSIEMTKIFINKFPNQSSKGQDKLFFAHNRVFHKSLEVYRMLVSNRTLSCTHPIFTDYKFLSNLSVNHFKNFLENCLGFNGELKELSHGMYKVYDLETLKYLEDVKEKFKPTLKFYPNSILSYASSNRDFQLFKYLVESPSFRSGLNPIGIEFSNTSFEIVKYCFENFENYIFNDLCFTIAYDGDLEFAKFIIDKFKSSDGERVTLTYRCIDEVCQKNYTHILKYFLENLPEIQISREPINFAIKNENFEMVQLLIDRIPTKPKDKPTLYDTTIEKLQIYSKKDNRILNSLINSQIYNKILFEKYPDFII